MALPEQRLPRGARIVDDMILVGDECWTMDDLRAWRADRDRDNRRDRARRADPDYRARYNARLREWRARNRERYNAYMRDWMRARRAA
jgi:phosphoribosylaminoimidazole-succinocarboxamide synthase